ncbi:retrovirus-related pol polyprotein from transposon TNT 1-94 [Tanacetum coccineum]
MNTQKRPITRGIGINNGMNDTTVIPLPGASHHMTGILEDLSNLNEIVQSLVELPNGNIAMAIKEGDAIEKEREPVTYYEAIKDKRWRSAMDSELKALEQNKTWTIDKLTPKKKALRYKWVYKIKYKSDGTIERFKARLVILDYSLFTLQQNGVQLNVLVYVDDLIASGNDHEVARAKEGIFLCQGKYALDIIFEVGLLGAKPAKILMEQNHYLGLAQRRLFEDPEQYRREPKTRRSLTGWLVYLGDSPISWKTKKQHTVSRSSAEAEYRSMALTTGELKWLKGLLKSFGIHHSQPMLLYCDSQAALHISRNPVFHERTKHIEVDCHYIRDELVSGNLDARHVHTKEQVADFFTKALGKAQFDYLLRKLGVQDLHLPT